ncbi:MAG: hypothetical protein GY913_28695 [Proteobacteria bacterium]|nr:hypothetical protein [Pseudomonadota bacterium]
MTLVPAGTTSGSPVHDHQLGPEEQLGTFAEVFRIGGDVDGDGFPELLVADESFAAYAVPVADLVGDGAMVDVSDVAHQRWAGFTHTVVALGDLDGDGYADWAAGEPYSNEGGAVRFFGGAASSTDQASEDAVASWRGEPGSSLGLSSTAGDTDGDGRAELLVQAEVEDVWAWILVDLPELPKGSWSPGDHLVMTTDSDQLAGRNEPAVRDLDGDGDDELVWSGYPEGTTGGHGGLAVVQGWSMWP